jgi:hypothetical protein
LTLFIPTETSEDMEKGGLDWGFSRKVATIERGKKKKSFGRENDETKRRGHRSSSFILKKVRILVQLQVQLTSLRTWVVSLQPWILQIMGWSIITWETSTTVHTVFRTTGPHVSHTCPSRHLKVQSYEDTCEVACVAKKGNEFTRQPSLLRLLEDTVSVHSVHPLRRWRSSCCSKHHTVFWRSPSRHFVCRSPVRNTR